MDRIQEFELRNNNTRDLSPEMASELDMLDNELTDAKLAAESKCKRRVQTVVPENKTPE
jgi:hypothetical protein